MDSFWPKARHRSLFSSSSIALSRSIDMNEQ